MYKLKVFFHGTSWDESVCLRTRMSIILDLAGSIYCGAMRLTTTICLMYNITVFLMKKMEIIGTASMNRLSLKVAEAVLAGDPDHRHALVM
jgi:hypothetical protein